MKYGFIGLGTMGFPMCSNLLKAGYSCLVYDTQKEVVEKLVKLKAEGAKDISDLAQKSEIVFLSLPYGKVVEKVLNDILSTANSQIKIIIDFSTISPNESVSFSENLKNKGIIYLDCPISGALEGAIQGNLTMMLGCDENTFNLVKEPLSTMGKKIFCTGKVGNGSAIKLINNYLVGINNIMVCEMMIVAKKLGMNLIDVFDIINNSSGRSFTTEKLKETFLDNRDFEVGFKVDLLYKDLNLIMDISKSIQFPLLIGANAVQLLELARSEGYGQNNTYSLVKMFEVMTDIKVN